MREEQLCQISPGSDLKWRSLRLFEERRPNNKNNNKMSSDRVITETSGQSWYIFRIPEDGLKVCIVCGRSNHRVCGILQKWSLYRTVLFQRSAFVVVASLMRRSQQECRLIAPRNAPNDLSTSWFMFVDWPLLNTWHHQLRRRAMTCPSACSLRPDALLLSAIMSKWSTNFPFY